MLRILSLLFILISAPLAASPPQQAGGPLWQAWSKAAFDQARTEGRFIILDLEAVWCHWCHVMEETTYQDPQVVKLIGEHYVALRVDQDARPDLANRYREYGWPATIFFAPDGREIAKRSGYIAPENMRNLLQAIVDDPSPEAVADVGMEATAPSNGILSDELRATLKQRHRDSMDRSLGGLDIAQKYLERDAVEWAMLLAAEGDREQGAWTRRTLEAAQALLDPAWGGAYQYSTHGDWKHPHFEKIMQVQAGYIRAYALAFQQWNDPSYRHSAEKIAAYLMSFLDAPDGGFYTSQDADLVQGEHSAEYFDLNDAQRRVLGIPRVDTQEYARETGWAAEALATLYEATGEQRYLDRAIRGVRWAMDQRALKGGGFRHAERDVAGPYLGDTLAMGRAFLHIYRVTADRAWLQHARQAAGFIAAHFQAPAGGFVSARDDSSPIAPLPQIDENISLVRFMNLLSHYTGDHEYRKLAEHGMVYLSHPGVAKSRLTEAGILLADRELNQDPTHLTIIGHKDQARADELFTVALRQKGWYKRVEWWDTREGPLPNPDVQYPVLDKPAAFVCTHQRCSLPLFTPKAVASLLERLGG